MPAVMVMAVPLDDNVSVAMGPAVGPIAHQVCGDTLCNRPRMNIMGGGRQAHDQRRGEGGSENEDLHCVALHLLGFTSLTRQQCNIVPDTNLNVPFIRGSAGNGYSNDMHRRDFIGLLAALATFGALPSRAAAQRGPDRARRALRRGDILPLRDVIAMVRRRIPGKIVDVQLLQRDRRFAYRLKILNRQDHVMIVLADAKSGRILRVRGRRR